MRWGVSVYPDHFEDVKDTEGPEPGLTWRQAYIAYSEEEMKPRYGKDVFGLMLLSRLVIASPEDELLVIIVGFREEAQPLVAYYGSEEVVLVRLQAPGCNFRGDSRAYLDLSDMGVRCEDVMNLKTDLVDFRAHLGRVFTQLAEDGVSYTRTRGKHS